MNHFPRGVDLRMGEPMQRLIVLSALLIVAFTPLILAMQQSGYTAPPPEIVSFLHLRDCELPCWAGIILQRTTLDEAKQHLLALYNTFNPQITLSSDLSFVIMLHDSDNNDLASIHVRSNYQLVSDIRLTLLQSQPQQIRPQQFIEIVQVYWLPTCAFAEGFPRPEYYLSSQSWQAGRLLLMLYNYLTNILLTRSSIL